MGRAVAGMDRSDIGNLSVRYEIPEGYVMIKVSTITLTYIASITALLMIIFPKFRDDMGLIWFNLKNGGNLGFNLDFINTDNFFLIFLGLCGVATGGILWWHHRPN
jgi:hypothetical protein